MHGMQCASTDGEQVPLVRERSMRLPLLNFKSLCRFWVPLLFSLPALPSGTIGGCTYRRCMRSAGPCQQQCHKYKLCGVMCICSCVLA
jgi:hypothetical protein